MTFDLDVEGKVTPIRLFSSKTASTKQFLEQVDDIVKVISTERSKGLNVKIRNPISRNPATWGWLKRRILGHPTARPAPGPPLGHAPPASVAETGVPPNAGDVVTVLDDAGVRRQTKVVSEPNFEPAGPDEGIPFDSFTREGYEKLRRAGFTVEEIGGLDEVEFHVTAAMVPVDPKNLTRGARVRRDVQQAKAAGKSIAPEGGSEIIDSGFDLKQAIAAGYTYEEFLTMLTRKALSGQPLSKWQAGNFPYLQRLSQKMARGVPMEEVELLGMDQPVGFREAPTDVGHFPPEMRDEFGRPKPGAVMTPVYERVVAPLGHATPGVEEGVIFHPQAKAMTPAVAVDPMTQVDDVLDPKRLTRGRPMESAEQLAVRRRKQAQYTKEVASIERRLASETDPATRAQLERSLANARADLKGVADPPPPAERPKPRRKPRPPANMVEVTQPDGSTGHVHISRVFVEAPVKAGEPIPKRRLTAHPDGSVRHGYVHLESGEVSVEGYGANLEPGDNPYRDATFTSIDPENVFGRDLRMFVHADGTVDLSNVPVSHYVVEHQAGFGHGYEFGPLDLAEHAAGRDKTMLSGGFRSGEEVLGFAPRAEPPAFGRFPSGFQARRIRKDISMEKRTKPDVRRPAAQEDVSFNQEDLGYPDLDVEDELDEPLMRVRAGDITTRRGNWTHRELTATSAARIASGLPTKRRPPTRGVEYQLTREMLEGAEPHAEWATVRRAARILQKQGYEDSTRLRVRIARETHQAFAADDPITMTIREAASLELPLPNSDKLFIEASARGITVLPSGTGHKLVLPDGSKRVFKDDLEALEAVQRIPINRVDLSLDQPLARLWNMGVENGFDAEVDARTFLPIPLQEVMVGQLLKGSRPLAEVRTSSMDAFEQAFAMISRDLPAGRRLTVMPLEKVGKVTRLAIYDPDLVKARMTTFQASFEQLGLNFEKNSLPAHIMDLDGMPHGLHTLQGNDPESGIMYTWYRQHSMKGNWQQGKVVVDETGPQRVFTTEQKNGFLFRVC